MTDRIEYGAHEIAWPGCRIVTGETIPGAGTWEIVEHSGCSGRGELRALIPGRTAPACDVCGHAVHWQLSHMASTAAEDHRGAGPLP